jgi:hypothetical protein
LNRPISLTKGIAERELEKGFMVQLIELTYGNFQVNIENRKRVGKRVRGSIN